jgi:hypothetical protein
MTVYTPFTFGDPSRWRHAAGAVADGGGHRPALPATIMNRTSSIDPGFGTTRPDFGMTETDTSTVDRGLTGYAAGLVDTRTFASSAASPETLPSYIALGDMSLNLYPHGSKAGASINLSDSTGQTDGQDLEFGYRGLDDPNGRGRSAYVDFDRFAAIDARGSSMDIRSTVGGKTPQTHHAALASSGAVGIKPGDNLLGVRTCKCEYMRWGFWSSTAEAAGDTPGSKTRTETQIGTWVAGRKPAVGTIPESGKATYAGHAIASIDNAGNRYLAAGGFENSVDFGKRTGDVTVSNLDGRTYSGQVNLNTATNGSRTVTSPDFGGTISGGDRQMNLNGSFFASPKDPVNEMGGTLSITGDKYRGAGTFAASRVP